MSDRQFAIAAPVVACVTVAFVAFRNGLGFWETMLWVAVAAGAVGLVAVSFALARLLGRGRDPFVAYNLSKPVALSLGGFCVVLVGVFQGDGGVIGWGVGMIAVGALLVLLIRGRSTE